MLRRLAQRGRAPGSVARVIADLEAERAELAAPPPRGGAVDLDLLRSVVEARVLELREAFEGATEKRRAAFRALLGDRKMRVFPDEERRFRVEGLFELTLEAADARAVGHWASASAGSGGLLRPGLPPPGAVATAGRRSGSRGGGVIFPGVLPIRCLKPPRRWFSTSA